MPGVPNPWRSLRTWQIWPSGAPPSNASSVEKRPYGRRVTALSYEGYEAMAVAALGRIEREACVRFEIRSCRIVHRLGDVPLTEASVAVVVAAAHRAPAFDACRWAMDDLKRTVPIWKKEFFAGGGEEWVGGTKLGTPE